MLNLNEELKKIETKNDLRSEERYFSNEHKKIKGSHFHYTVLYDENFKETRKVIVRYTNAVKHLTRIARKDQADNIVYDAYKLTQLNNDFYKVEKTEDTSKGLVLIAESLKPNRWIGGNK